MIDLALALFLTLLAVAILWYLGTLVVRAAGLPVGRWTESWRFERHAARARSADRLLENGEIEAALREIRRAFYLLPVASPELAATVANHHTGLLSRILAMTSERGGSVRLLSLAKVDRLLSERAALQRRRVGLLGSGARRAIAEIDERLRRNAADLAQALDQLADEVRSILPRARSH